MVESVPVASRERAGNADDWRRVGRQTRTLAVLGGQMAMAARTSASDVEPPVPLDVMRPASRM
ncbi:hypothetical protein BN970_07035 [Mycolicibacterium conceptionense]|uniref:Uncharacterized protein n=1 Tax=Mycolicibacterium conceptionense TaxID=451644 RepID=A0A0U1DZ22_9MYCO|nr:hypothetical protein BN970_07035 [Mycolicibacterium conceptionense]